MNTIYRILCLLGSIIYMACSAQTQTAAVRRSVDIPPKILDKDASNELSEEDSSEPAVKDIIALLDVMEWKPLGNYTSGTLPITKDIKISDEFYLNSFDVELPDVCNGIDGCNQQVYFEIEEETKGTKCTDVFNTQNAVLCRRVLLSNTTVRFRTVLLDLHPSEYNLVPVVQILPSSSTSCSPSRMHCISDNTCWRTFDSYCRHCLGQDKEICACSTSEGQKEEDERCWYSKTNDVMEVGKCQNDKCISLE